MFRVRAAAFLAGFASAAAIGMYMVQKDVHASHRILVEQAERCYKQLDSRISRLEQHK